MNNTPEHHAVNAGIAKATINTLYLAVMAAVLNSNKTQTPLAVERFDPENCEVIMRTLARVAGTLEIPAETALIRCRFVHCDTARLIDKLAEAAELAILEWTFPAEILYGEGMAALFSQPNTTCGAE